jgi:aryl-alcohol dehydrogenase-like predicted oxidoreductase
VASTIIGATSDEQLRQNLAAFEVALPPECLREVDALHKQYRDPAFI